MDLVVLDQQFQMVHICDNYKSMIWTDRYNAYGDFELYVPVSVEAIAYFAEDNYLWNRTSKHLMIVDELTVESDIDLGPSFKITGLSLESVLNRRIIWDPTVLSGNLQDEFYNKILVPNAINPSNGDRKLPLRFIKSEDPRVTELTINQEVTGDTIYDYLTEHICKDNNLGFQVVLGEDNVFEFSFYYGVDHSYDNKDNTPWVIFSPNYENMINSNYYDTTRDWKNMALVAGEDTNKNRRTVEINPEDPSLVGLHRRELYVDARDIQSERTDEGSSESHPIPIEEYNGLLRTRGNEKLAENDRVMMFEGEVDTARTFVYDKDYTLGDLVQLQNEWGLEAKCRVSEIIFSDDGTGYKVVPTFVAIEDDDPAVNQEG